MHVPTGTFRVVPPADATVTNVNVNVPVAERTPDALQDQLTPSSGLAAVRYRRDQRSDQAHKHDPPHDRRSHYPSHRRDPIRSEHE